MQGERPRDALTRRALLGRAAAGASTFALAGALPRMVGSARGATAEGWIPDPARVRADIQRMVDFGPRLTGSDAHNGYIDWLEREFVAAGCELVPCDTYQTSRWLEEGFSLDVLDGAGAGPVKVATYFPRSQQTPASGVSGPLVYGGTMPGPSINGGDVAALEAALARYPGDLASWAMALPGVVGDPRGSIMVVDAPVPPPATIGALLGPAVTYYSGQGETVGDLLTQDYKRLWTVPGLALPLDAFTAIGVAGVVLIVDASYAALKGCYAPFEYANQGVPALYVDRDTGIGLREQAGGRPNSRLTLTATRKTVPTATVTAVLPGRSKEVVIFNTHTDGTGFVEENGAVGFVQLARYFGSLPASRRLARTLVFACWPGHFSNDLPQGNGWIADHQDIMSRAAAALTLEHVGCTEWNDTTDQGYMPTGKAELFAVWTTQGQMFNVTRDATIAANLPRTALLRPPAQFGVGGPFQTAGIPQIGAIAGPEYLLTVSDNSDMDKLDERLAARQLGWLADLATRLETVSAEDLRQGDPTLGAPTSTGNIEPSSATSKALACGPLGSSTVVATRAGGSLIVRYYGRRRAAGGVLVVLEARGERVSGVVVELRHGTRLVARNRVANVGEAPVRVVLRQHGHHGHVAAGSYELLVRQAGAVLVRRLVRLG